MKTLFLASAAAAALFAAPALAQDAIGSVGLTYSNPSVEIAGEDFDADVWTVDGTVAIPANNWTVTFNGAIDHTKAFGEDDTTGAAAAHLTTMVASDVRVGGPGVDGKHAQLTVSMAGYTVVDLGSPHGTRVNAEKIRERLLRDQDVIQIGAARWVFREG